MGKTRPPYPREYREEAVRLVRESGTSIGQIAKDLGIALPVCLVGKPSVQTPFDSMLVAVASLSMLLARSLPDEHPTVVHRFRLSFASIDKSTNCYPKNTKDCHEGRVT